MSRIFNWLNYQNSNVEVSNSFNIFWVFGYFDDPHFLNKIIFIICPGTQVCVAKSESPTDKKIRLDQVRLGQVRLGQVRLGQVRLGQVRLGQVRLGQVRLGQVRLAYVTKSKSPSIKKILHQYNTTSLGAMLRESNAALLNQVPAGIFLLGNAFQNARRTFFKTYFFKYTHHCRFYFDLYFNICLLRYFVLDSKPIVKKIGHHWPIVFVLTKQFFKLLTFYPKANNFIKLLLCYTSSQKMNIFWQL